MQLMQSQLPRWVIVVAPDRYPVSMNPHAFEHDIVIDLDFEIQLDQNITCKLIVILNILNVYC